MLRLARGLSNPTDGYFLRAESFFNVATYMDQVGYLDSYGGKSLHARFLNNHPRRLQQLFEDDDSDG